MLELIEVADRFCFLKLKDALAEQLTTLINVPSVLYVLVCADRLGLDSVLEACFNFADMNACAVLKEESLLSLQKDLLKQLLSRDTFVVEEIAVYEAVDRWMKENMPGRCDSSLLQCIRLSEIPAQRLLDLAVPDGWFSEREVLTNLRVQMRSVFADMNPRGRLGERCQLLQCGVVYISPAYVVRVRVCACACVCVCVCVCVL